MVALIFSDLPHLIYEVKCLLEIGETKHTLNMVLVDHAPGGHLSVECLQFFPLQRRDTSAARNAFLVG